MELVKSFNYISVVKEVKNEQKSRFILSSQDEPEYEFLFEIISSKKITFRISLHNQENNSKEGLIRIDYRSGHKNPESITEFVPEIVKISGLGPGKRFFVSFAIRSYQKQLHR